MMTFQQRCDEILQYLQTHPDGAATAEEIADWLVTERNDEETRNLEVLDQALDHLMQQGLLERHVLVHGTILYEPAPPKPPS